MAKKEAPSVAHELWEYHKKDIVKWYIDKDYNMKIVRDKLAKKGCTPIPE